MVGIYLIQLIDAYFIQRTVDKNWAIYQDSPSKGFMIDVETKQIVTKEYQFVDHYFYLGYKTLF
ncbi:MAG: hypothetical protein H7A23_04245 [Leptospiraceae bacterium]|nr:hypothetical protein [Leptospiraceae bacterium]MCP5493743.1 hypothetical protein [Leptospiraceae bacterium]